MNIHVALFFWFIAVYGILEIYALRISKSIFQIGTRDLTYYIVTIPGILSMVLPLFIAISKQTFSNYRYAVGVLLIISGIFIRIKGVVELKGYFSTIVEKKAEHKLVTSGLHSIIRHPAYLGTLLISFSTLIALGSPFWLFFLPIVTVLGVLIRIRKEERFLIANLSGYGEYMKKTWRLIPRIF